VINHQAAFRKALKFSLAVDPYLRQKVEAIAAHRSQFPIQPDLLPLAVLQAMMGEEYFVPVSLVSEVEPEFLALQGAL
jgi:hypothetical protein